MKYFTSYKAVFIALVVILIGGTAFIYYLDYRVSLCFNKTNVLFMCSQFMTSFRYLFFPLWFAALVIIQVLYLVEKKKENNQVGADSSLPVQNKVALSKWVYFGLALSLGINSYLFWLRALNFLSKIGILKVNDLGLGFISVGILAIFLTGIVIIPLYARVLVKGEKKILQLAIIFFFSSLIFFPVYSFRSLKPFPFKYWFNYPTNYSECVEAGGKVMIEYKGPKCDLGQYPWGEMSFTMRKK